MKKILVITALCGLVLQINSLKAQKAICGNELVQQYIDADPVLKAANEQYWAKYVKENNEMARAANKTTATHVTIPVVFHIVLTQAQINELGGTSGVYERVATQIEAITEDFNASNSDVSTVPAAFQSVIGDAKMSFAVAKRNPSNQATYAVNFLVKDPSFTGYNPHANNVKRSISGGLDPWDNTKYLNVWVTNITQSGGQTGQVLGWGYNPGYAQLNYGDANLGGVVIHYLTLGRRTGIGQKFYSANTDKGRTLTHELGHFFNIWHIWGNTPVGNGNCADDDGIGDTPRQEDANQQCPFSANTVIPNCPISSHAGGEMYMNFMDYSGDKCTKMFTVQQVQRMRAEVDPGGGQHGLTTDPTLSYWPANTSIVEYNNKLSLSPNPTNGKVYVQLVNKNNKLEQITVSNIMGQTVKNINVTDQAVQSYQIDLTGSAKGVYMVQLHFDAGVISRKVVLQ